MGQTTPVAESQQRTQAGEPLHPKPPDPVAPRPARKGGELGKRLATAAVLVPPVIYVIAIGGLPYLFTVMAIVLLAQREFYGLIEDKGARPEVRFGLAAGAALPVVAYLGNEYHATILMTVTLLAVMVLQLRKARITQALASISGTFFGVFYVGWLMAHAVVLRFFYDVVAGRRGFEQDPGRLTALTGLVPDSGIFFMLFTLVVVVWCDAGAYFAGHAYGRRKLAPKVSPGKTVEGAIGGILAGILGGAVAKGVFDVFWPALSASLDWLAVLLFGLALSVVGILGDLIESLLKRDAEKKDTGWLLPGMGGVLDRIDSPLLAIPVMYYMLTFYLFLRVG